MLAIFPEALAEAVEAFAVAHHLRLTKYHWEQSLWRMEFRHPEGGVGCVDVKLETASRVRVECVWWKDDYDSETRGIRFGEAGSCSAEWEDLDGLLEAAVRQVLRWQDRDLDRSRRGIGGLWHSVFSKEAFEAIDSDLREPEF